MARYRSRSRSYSPHRRSRTPPRDRKRYEEEPRDRYRDSRSYRDRRSPAPSGLLVRNLPLDARPEDLRAPFERFGQVKDVYLPKNYYSGSALSINCFIKPFAVLSSKVINGKNMVIYVLLFRRFCQPR
ncbi:serine/arginine-rich SC35-like splicing factor SCL28 [Fagus crenata]